MENPILNAVSVRGTIENSRSQGFSVADSVSEKIDNSKKAGCDQFVIYLDKENLHVTLVDNGSGQTKTGLANSYILNNRTKASKLNQSKFGQGGKMLEIELSDCKASSIALSKKSGEKLHQVDANWAEAISADRFDILAHGAEKNKQIFGSSMQLIKIKVQCIVFNAQKRRLRNLFALSKMEALSSN
jgi:hypothetical protein